jgi:hypothetical protein
MRTRLGVPGDVRHAASFRAVKDRVPPYTKRHVASEVRKLLHTASHTHTHTHTHTAHLTER